MVLEVSMVLEAWCWHRTAAPTAPLSSAASAADFG
jgi:hypothetical protein